MFSVQQKRNISNAVQQILRDTGHPELPADEIKFMLHVHGRFQWQWADIQNNSAIPVPSVNPWNEAQAQPTPAEDRYGREPKKVKPLAQYLAEYVEQDKWDFSTIVTEFRGAGHSVDIDINDLKRVLEQALDAYESTENVKIRIERV